MDATRKTLWSRAFKLTLPVGMGYIPTGFAFGVLGTEAGFPLSLTIGMSCFIFAGALQFAAIPLLVSGAGVVTMAVTTLLINLRHVLYALPLLDYLPHRRASRGYVIAALTDENFSVLSSTPADAPRADLALPVSFINHGYWIAGTAVGALAGQQAMQWVPHIAFALPCLFTILAIEQYLAKRSWFAIGTGLVAFVVARAFSSKFVLIGALLIGLVVLCIKAISQEKE
jgi:4-azaleucine resistance transporter AzlC